MHRLRVLVIEMFGAACIALLTGCTLPPGGGLLAHPYGIGYPNPNPAARGPMYYRYIPSAAHNYSRNGFLQFPGPDPDQIGKMPFSVSVDRYTVVRGLRQFVYAFYVGGFPEVQKKVEACYNYANYYLYRPYLSKIYTVMPCLAEDDAAYLYNLLLHENWGRPLYPYFTVVPLARRNLTELKLSHKDLKQSDRIMALVSDDLNIAFPTLIELPVTVDRPGT